ncbi:MAG: family 10 glycosylhydrolase [Planctomycetaceae bacterium]|nr:family 10 glycosylhydrolase [Planctomycetaceae bacterium]
MRHIALVFVLLFANLACGETLYQFEGKTLTLPFATEKTLERVYEDFELKADLTAFDQFQLTLDVQNPSAIGTTTLYFRSGGGWYSINTTVTKTGLQTLTFDKSRPMSEGTPAGFDKVDTFRVGFWRGQAIDSSLKLEKLEASTHSILLLVPENRSEGERQAAANLQQKFLENGVPFVRVTKNELEQIGGAEKLKGRKILLTSEGFNEQVGDGSLVRITYLNDGSLKYGNKIGNDTFSMLSLLGEADPTIWRILIEKKKKAIESVGQLPEGYESFKAAQARDVASFQKLPEKVDLYPGFYKKLCEFHEQRVTAYLTSFPSKPNEFRAWWEHAGTGAYPGDWDRTMKELSENGFNAVIPNMLWGGLAHYESDLLPRSETFEKYGDQIAQAVAAGKKYGVEVHVWKVNYYASHRAPKSFFDEMRNQGRLLKKFNGEEDGWLCPSHPLNRALERDSMLEVAEKYDVDGIHFDYIRYPNDNACYCDGCKERFTEFARSQNLLKADETLNWPRDCGYNGRFKSEYNQWRCDQVTALVADVHAAVKEKNLKVKISAALWPMYPQCKEWVLQEWPLWVERGYLDFICTMNYTISPAAFSGYIKAQLELTGGKIPIYPGIGATVDAVRLKPEEIAVQIDIARQNGLDGFTIFNLSQTSITEIPPALATGPTK